MPGLNQSVKVELIPKSMFPVSKKESTPLKVIEAALAIVVPTYEGT